MFNRLRQRMQDERGFTLIELLVVILIIGILAAIAIPSFLNQQSKAQDSQAKELARTAETTAETVATDNNGSYAEVSLTSIPKYEKAIATTENEKEAWLSAVTGTTGGYSVTVTAPVSKDKFTITKASTGAITRTCEVTKESNAGGCKLTGGTGTTGSW